MDFLGSGASPRLASFCIVVYLPILNLDCGLDSLMHVEEAWGKCTVIDLIVESRDDDSLQGTTALKRASSS